MRNLKHIRILLFAIVLLLTFPVAHAFKCSDQIFKINLTQPEGYIYIGPPKITITPRIPSGNHINTFLHLHTVDHPFKFYKHWKQSIPFGFTSLEGYGDQTMQLMCSDDSSSRSPSHDSYIPVSNIVKYANQPHGTLESKLKDGDLIKAEGMDPYQMISPTLGPVLVYPPGNRNTLMYYKSKKNHEVHLESNNGGLIKNTKFEYDNLQKIIRTARGAPGTTGLPVTELDANGELFLTQEQLELDYYYAQGDYKGISLGVNGVKDEKETFWFITSKNKILDIFNFRNANNTRKNPLLNLVRTACDIKIVTLYRKYKEKYYAIAHSHGYTTEGRILHAIPKNRIISAEEFRSKTLKKSEHSDRATQQCKNSSPSKENADSSDSVEVPTAIKTCSPLIKEEIKNKFQGAMRLLDVMYERKKAGLNCR